MKVASSFQDLGSCFSEDRDLKEDVKWEWVRYCEPSVRRRICVKSAVWARMQRGDAWREVAPTVTYRVETRGMSEAQWQKVDFFKLKCLLSMCKVTRMKKRRGVRAGVRDKMSDGLEPKLFTWLRYVKRMSEEQLPRTLYCAEVEGCRDRGRLCLRWLDGVKNVYIAGIEVCKCETQGVEWRNSMNDKDSSANTIRMTEHTFDAKQRRSALWRSGKHCYTPALNHHLATGGHRNEFSITSMASVQSIKKIPRKCVRESLWCIYLFLARPSPSYRML